MAKRANQPKAATVLKLVPQMKSEATIAALAELMKHALDGEVIGIAYIAKYRGNEWRHDLVGEVRRSPNFSRAMLLQLDARLERLLYDRA